MAEVEKKSPAENSPLTDEELEHFKEKLLQEKKEAEKNIEEAKQSLEEIDSNYEDAKSAQDHHHSDLATKEDTKLAHLTAIDKNQEKLEKITVALDRIGTGDYGICVETGQPIQKERLEVMPYAIRSVGAKD
ncbi:MAG: TraR/DksA C4-type zinc finger protein [Balneolaceae bacterium]|nr:TraR/DksA C4-type zinc finger protein [Balneolaceae bacterium]